MGKGGRGTKGNDVSCAWKLINVDVEMHLSISEFSSTLMFWSLKDAPLINVIDESLSYNLLV